MGPGQPGALCLVAAADPAGRGAARLEIAGQDRKWLHSPLWAGWPGSPRWSPTGDPCWEAPGVPRPPALGPGGGPGSCRFIPNHRAPTAGAPADRVPPLEVPGTRCGSGPFCLWILPALGEPSCPAGWTHPRQGRWMIPPSAIPSGSGGSRAPRRCWGAVGGALTGDPRATDDRPGAPSAHTRRWRTNRRSGGNGRTRGGGGVPRPLRMRAPRRMSSGLTQKSNIHSAEDPGSYPAGRGRQGCYQWQALALNGSDRPQATPVGPHGGGNLTAEKALDCAVRLERHRRAGADAWRLGRPDLPWRPISHPGSIALGLGSPWRGGPLSLSAAAWWEAY